MYGKQNHKIEIIFPIMLLFIFAISALVVTLFATRVYEKTVNNTLRNDSARTAVAYVTEKIHQNDVSSAIELRDIGGSQALCINKTANGKQYVSYIYFDDGKLKELYASRDMDVNKSLGTEICELKSVSRNSAGNSLYRINCEDANGNTYSSVVGIRSN